MKKMFTLCAALISFSALFAQYDKPYDNRRHDDRSYNQNDSRDDNRNGGWNNNDPRMNGNQPDYRADRAVTMHRDDDRWQHNNRMNENDRRADMDRINHDYDRQIDVYRNDRRMNSYERDRRIDRLQRERSEKLKSFGGGAILGGILGMIIGSQL